MTEALKPCPFCGGEARLAQSNRNGGYWGICLNDGCMAETRGAITAREAAKIWNRRNANSQAATPEWWQDEAAAEREFTEYFCRNYPGPDTVISDPKWHAPKLFRAAKRALMATVVTPPANHQMRGPHPVEGEHEGREE